MERPCVEVDLMLDRTFLRLDWEGREVLRAALPPLLPETLVPLEALLSALSVFFRMPVSAVLIVDAWGGSPGPDSSSVINVHRAVPDCPQARHDARAARVKP